VLLCVYAGHVVVFFCGCVLDFLLLSLASAPPSLYSYLNRAFCDTSSLKGIAVPLLLFATLLLGVLGVVLPNHVVQSLRLLPANQLLRVSFLILHDRELQAQLGVW
jgi:hypothetical protein